MCTCHLLGGEAQKKKLEFSGPTVELPLQAHDMPTAPFSKMMNYCYSLDMIWCALKDSRVEV